MKNAIIGHTGFIGSYLRMYLLPNNTDLYNSTNINDINNKNYDIVYCAGISAKKWIANKNPESDLEMIQKLINNLKNVKINKLIIISTIDIHDNSIQEQDENNIIVSKEPYGLNRYYFEEEMKKIFDNIYIFRLPALFGLGLQKNMIFDLLNNKLIENINPNNKFQWYSLEWLWDDINNAINQNIKLLHLYSENIESIEIIKEFFPEYIDKIKNSNNIIYNQKTIYLNFWKTKEQVMEKLKNFINMYKFMNSDKSSKLCVSNIAWNSNNDEYYFWLLQKFNIKNIELVVSKYYDWNNITDENIEFIKEKYKNFNIYSMQSILYNIKENDNIIDRMNKVEYVANKLNIKRIVFGSPNIRKKTLDINKFIEILKMSDKICLEPNSKLYGCEIGTNLSEVYEIAISNNININFDTGNALMENDIIDDKYIDKIKHVQISMPNLKDLDNSVKIYIEFINKIDDAKISLEIKENENIFALNLFNFYNLFI